MRKLSSIVLLIHFAIILALSFLGTHVKKQPKARLVVKTIQLPQTPYVAERSLEKITPPVSGPVSDSAAPKKQAPRPSAAPPKPTPAAVKTVTQPQAKPVEKPKNTKPADPVKKPAQNKPLVKPTQDKSIDSKTAELIKELDATLSKIEKKSQPTEIAAYKHKTTPVMRLPTLQIDQRVDEIEDVDYEEELISLLHSQLELPEMGEVKIKLTLQNNGTFVKMEMITSQSVKNARYLQECLPKIRFPHFTRSPGMGQGNNREKTFTITFCNE